MKKSKLPFVLPAVGLISAFMPTAQLRHQFGDLRSSDAVKVSSTQSQQYGVLPIAAAAHRFGQTNVASDLVISAPSIGAAQTGSSVLSYDGNPIAFQVLTYTNGGLLGDIPTAQTYYVPIPSTPPGGITLSDLEAGLAAVANYLASSSNLDPLITLPTFYFTQGDNIYVTRDGSSFTIQVPSAPPAGAAFDYTATTNPGQSSVVATTAGTVTTPTGNITHLVSGPTLNSNNPVTASVNHSSVSSVVTNSSGAAYLASANSVTATAEGNTQQLVNTLGNGSNNAAVAVSDSNVNGSNVTATLSNSSLGVYSGLGISGGNTVVDSNTSGASALGNSSSSTLNAAGAASLTGSSAGVVLPSAPLSGTPGNLILGGNLLNAGSQTLDSSNVIATSTPVDSGTSSLGNTNIGITLGDLDPNQPNIELAISSATISNNTSSVSATGNALQMVTSETVAGSGKAVAVGSAQTVNNSAVNAQNLGTNVGVAADNSGPPFPDSILDSTVSVTGNALTSKATGNSLTVQVAADQSNSQDSLAVSNGQYLQGGGTNNSVAEGVSAQTVGGSIGVNTLSLEKDSTLNVSKNTASALAKGNVQSVSVDLSGAAAASGAGATISPVQEIESSNGTLTISASANASFGFAVSNNPAPNQVNREENISGSQLTVDSNKVISQAIGNDAQQSQTATASSISQDIGIDVQQSVGINSNARTIKVVSNADGSTLGAFGAGNVDSSTLTVTNNSIDSLAVSNYNTLVQSNLAGTITGAITNSVTQVDAGTAVTATASNNALGISNAPMFSPNIAQDGSVSILVDSNTLSANANVNQSSVTASAASGSAKGTLSQQATDSRAVAIVADNGLGLPYSSGPVANGPNTLTLQVTNNSLSAAANGNTATATGGAVAGELNSDAGVGASVTQSTDSVRSIAVARGENIGLVQSANSIMNLAPMPLQVTGNTVTSTARQNVYTETDGGVSGTLNATLSSSSTQTDAAGRTVAVVRDLNLGVQNQPGMGIFTAPLSGADINVSSNVSRADAAGNVSVQSLGGITGNVASNGQVVVNAQQNEGTDTDASRVKAVSNSNVIGLLDIVFLPAFDPLSILVNNNQILTVATANVAVQNLGDVSGSVTGDGIAFGTTQSLNSRITADSTSVDIVSVNASLGYSAAAQVSVNGNAILTAATGNSASTDLGKLSGTLQGNVSSAVNQTVAAGSQIEATTGDSRSGPSMPVQIGVQSFDVGPNVAASVTVSNNQIGTAVTGNTATSNASLVGQIGTVATLSDAEQQVIGATSTATTLSTSTSAVGIGMLVGFDAGSSAAVQVGNNTISAATTGNSVTQQLNLSSSASSGTVNVGTAVSGNTTVPAPGQSVVNTTLSASVDSSNIGFSTGEIGFGGASAESPAVAINGNTVVASSVSNQTTRNIAVTGIEPAGLFIGDTQSNQSVTQIASVSNVGIGDSYALLSPPNGLSLASPSSTVNSNAVLAQAVGNSELQTISLNGAVVPSLAQTNLSSIQSNIGGSIKAAVTSVQIGLDTTVGNPSSFMGNSVVTGNSIAATAIGNSTTATRK